MELGVVENPEKSSAVEFIVETETEIYNLQASVRLIGDDVLVAIWGGERPHIGAVAVAQPRPSLRDAAVISATASVFCFLGHKEDSLAKTVAETLAAKLNTQTVVTAGIHWDNLDAEGIRTINENSVHLTKLIIAQVLLHRTP